MSKTNRFYLVARDRLTDQFQIISIDGERKNPLEKIDLFTTTFQDETALAEELRKRGVIDYQDPDFYIVNQVKVDDKIYLRQQELLYANNRKHIEMIARNSLDKKIQKSIEQIDYILDSFADHVFMDPILYDHVVTGKTNVYGKYANYFTFNRSQGVRSIKYRDGAWARTSYPLIRNVLEADSRKNRRYARVSDEMHRHLLDERIIRVTGDNYDENQISMFDQFPEVVEDPTDQILEVVSTFESLPNNTFAFKNNHYVFNERLFPVYQEGDLEKFHTYLPEKIRIELQLLLMRRSYLEIEPQKFGESYLSLIREGQKNIISMLKEDPDVLEKAYLWCQLFDEYQEKDLGDVDARGVQKRKRDSRTS